MTRTESSRTTVPPNDFEKLLAMLDPAREKAGERYETIRLRLLKFFEWRQCPFPDDLVDDTFDRVARRVSEGEIIRAADAMPYFYGVARNVARESWKQREREQKHPLRRNLISVPDEKERAHDLREAALVRLECLRRCLARLPAESRSLLTEYYGQETRKSEVRKALALRLGIPLNALRIRVHRLKCDLSVCVDECRRTAEDEMSGRDRHISKEERIPRGRK